MLNTFIFCFIWWMVFMLAGLSRWGKCSPPKIEQTHKFSCSMTDPNQYEVWPCLPWTVNCEYYDHQGEIGENSQAGGVSIKTAEVCNTLEVHIHHPLLCLPHTGKTSHCSEMRWHLKLRAPSVFYLWQQQTAVTSIRTLRPCVQNKGNKYHKHCQYTHTLSVCSLKSQS